MNILESKTYDNFKIQFNLLKDKNQKLSGYYFLTDDEYGWNRLRFDKSDFVFTNNKHFREKTGFVPFLIDTENEDFYCYLPDENKIGVFSVHTIVQRYKNLDELLHSFNKLRSR